jgi:membrane-associated protein
VNHIFDLQPDSLFSYLVAILFPALDAVLPIVPSEAAIVALGTATAGSYDPRLILFVILAACGACVGDNVCYMIGRYFGPWVDRRAFTSERAARRRAWAQRTLERFGALVIVLCRFIPGGRTVVTFTCGAIGYPWRRFFPITILSGLVWATYAFVIGRIGGTAFASKPWLGLILALGIAAAVSLVVELLRRILTIRRRLEEERTTKTPKAEEAGRRRESPGSTTPCRYSVQAASCTALDSSTSERKHESSSA